jgi:hypothetical protein
MPALWWICKGHGGERRDEQSHIHVPRLPVDGDGDRMAVPDTAGCRVGGCGPHGDGGPGAEGEAHHERDGETPGMAITQHSEESRRCRRRESE